MSAITIDAVLSSPDVLVDDHFDFIIPSMPGGGDSSAFTIRNMTAVLPGKGTTTITTEIHRHKVHQANKVTYGSNTFTATFVDSADRKILGGLQAWEDAKSDPETNLPRPKAEYQTEGAVRIYGATNEVVEARTFYNLFVESVNDAPLSGSSDNALIFSVTFRYDIWKYGEFTG